MKACIVVISVPLLAQWHLSEQYNCSSDWHNAHGFAAISGEVQEFGAVDEGHCNPCPGCVDLTRHPNLE